MVGTTSSRATNLCLVLFAELDFRLPVAKGAWADRNAHRVADEIGIVEFDAGSFVVDRRSNTSISAAVRSA